MHPRAAGWIKTLYVRTEGEAVKRKDTLADFYSPYITQVQLDFLQALEEQDLAAFGSEDNTDINNKVSALRNSLRQLNVMDMEIKRIKTSRTTLGTIPIMAPHSGDIIHLGVREGMYVEPFNRMFTIVDLSYVWVMIDLHEHQAAWVKPGMRTEIEAPAIPGRKWIGSVDYIYPVVNPKTRTLRARIEIPNPDEALLLNMFVEVSLLESAKQHRVIVPREAVIVTGERETVIKALGNGHFQPVEVTSGIWSDGKAEILSGLKEGDEVVVSGQFLIDSESSLQASFLRMSE
jgi:Cu(I)/Ag(I) efflux system membrane fusion protein